MGSYQQLVTCHSLCSSPKVVTLNKMIPVSSVIDTRLIVSVEVSKLKFTKVCFLILTFHPSVLVLDFRNPLHDMSFLIQRRNLFNNVSAKCFRYKNLVILLKFYWIFWLDNLELLIVDSWYSNPFRGIDNYQNIISDKCYIYSNSEKVE